MTDPDPRPLPDLPDADVVARAHDGSEEAYGELLRRYQHRVHALVHGMVRDHDLADDLTQETFLRAFEALRTRPPKGKFETWILKSRTTSRSITSGACAAWSARGSAPLPIRPDGPPHTTGAEAVRDCYH